MKTRMHRFWLSITLAAGSLGSPLAARLSAHDLPWRWASQTVSSSDWNYLRDDCLDSRPLSPYGAAVSRSVEESLAGSFEESLDSSTDSSIGALGTCPAEEAIAKRFDAALAHQSAAKFASEMACWANKWEQMQKRAGEVARARLVSHRQEVLSQWAARPDFGAPPAPAAPIADTCSFESEYRAMQAAADLLDAEMARAAEVSAREAQLYQALADVEAIEAAAVDAMAEHDSGAAAVRSAVAALAADRERSSCGELDEIVSQQEAHSDFAPPVDEYMAYDLDGREAHWLGGLGKSWRLRAAISASAAAEAKAKAKADLAASDASAADSFGADEYLEFLQPAAEAESDSVASDAAGSDLADSNQFASEIIEAPSEDEFALCDFVGPIAQSAASDEPAAAELVAAKPDAGVAPAPAAAAAFALKDRLADGLEWLELTSCVIAAEMCGMDQAHRLGEQWGDWSLAAAGNSMTSYVAMGQYLDRPPMVVVPAPDLEPKSDVYVVYSDAAIDELAAYEFNGAIAVGSEPAAPPAAQLAAQSAARPASSASSVNLAQLRRHVLNLAARELDAIGMSCLQTADQLSNWADPQIASRQDNDIR